MEECYWCGQKIEFSCDEMEILFAPELRNEFWREVVCVPCFRKFMQLREKCKVKE